MFSSFPQYMVSWNIRDLCKLINSSSLRRSQTFSTSMRFAIYTTYLGVPKVSSSEPYVAKADLQDLIRLKPFL